MDHPDNSETKEQLGTILVAENKAREAQQRQLDRLTEQLKDHEEPQWPLTAPSLTSRPPSPPTA